MNEINKMLAVSKRNSGGVFRKYNCWTNTWTTPNILGISFQPQHKCHKNCPGPPVCCVSEYPFY
jgi:hypothetical protein